jgi:hypothetical protein
MRIPLQSLLLGCFLVISFLFSFGCKPKASESIPNPPIQKDIAISVPEFAPLEIVGSNDANEQTKSDDILSTVENIEKVIIPVRPTNELIFKGGESPTPAVKNGNGFSILISSSRLEVGEPITFYVNTSSPLIWQLGDGTTNTGKRISHVFQKPGQYKVEAYNKDKSQRNRIEILVLCSPSFVLNKINVIQKAAYSNDEKVLLKEIEAFNQLCKSNDIVIELLNHASGNGSRKFIQTDAFIDYLLIRTEQNKEKGYIDQAVISGVKRLETFSESSLLSKIIFYEE